MTSKLEHSKAQQTGPTHKLPAYPMIPPKKYENIQENARSQTNLLNMYTGGRRRRRKSRKKRRRRRRRSRRGGVPSPVINPIPEEILGQRDPIRRIRPLWRKINEIIATQGVWVNGSKPRAAPGFITPRRSKTKAKPPPAVVPFNLPPRRRPGGSRRRISQRGGKKSNKPSIGSEDSLCGSYQTPDESQFTPDKYIVVPQPSGSAGTNQTAINLAKTLTQARANSEGDFSVIDTVFQDDSQKVGNLKLPKGGRRKSRKKKRRRKSRKKKHRRRSRR